MGVTQDNFVPSISQKLTQQLDPFNHSTLSNPIVEFLIGPNSQLYTIRQSLIPSKSPLLHPSNSSEANNTLISLPDISPFIFDTITTYLQTRTLPAHLLGSLSTLSHCIPLYSASITLSIYPLQNHITDHYHAQLSPHPTPYIHPSDLIALHTANLKYTPLYALALDSCKLAFRTRSINAEEWQRWLNVLEGCPKVMSVFLDHVFRCKDGERWFIPGKVHRCRYHLHGFGERCDPDYEWYDQRDGHGDEMGMANEKMEEKAGSYETEDDDGDVGAGRERPPSRYGKALSSGSVMGTSLSRNENRVLGLLRRFRRKESNDPAVFMDAKQQ